MQTFLPYPDFVASAKVLDQVRLNKQLVECQQIFNALSGNSKGWRNHPVTRMWAGHRLALFEYMTALNNERINRGLSRSHHGSWKAIRVQIYGSWEEAVPFGHLPNREAELPAWIGLEELHSSHRANLLRKDPTWYGQFGWSEEPAQGYPYELALKTMEMQP